MNAEAQVHQIDPAGIVADLDARARRIETSCGDGAIVWRIWGEGEPLVLGHGAQGAWSHWIHNIPGLAEKRMVIAIDMPGQGDSAAPPQPDHDAISTVIADGLNEILGDRLPIDIVGFSMGGVCLAHLAYYRPDMVRRLIAVATGGIDTPMGHVELRRLKGLDEEQRKEAVRANLLAMMLHHRESADDLAIHLLLTNARKARVVSRDLVLPARLLKILPDIRVPIDAIWGELDAPHPDPVVQEAVFRRFQPNMEFRVIPDAGHWVMYERPEAFNATLLEMLAKPVRTMRQ